MPTKYRRHHLNDVHAIQFTGGEDSAAAVIAWARAVPEGPEVHRHKQPGSWNDEHPDLWLEIRDHGVRLYAEPGQWLVVEGDDCDVLTAPRFEETYEALIAPV